MMAQPVPHHSDESQTTDKKRVKVYELRSNDWFDRGTGFCSASFIPVRIFRLAYPRGRLAPSPCPCADRPLHRFPKGSLERLA